MGVGITNTTRKRDKEGELVNNDHGSVWIPVAKAGQHNKFGVTMTHEGLQKSYASLRDGRVSINHLAPVNGAAIIDVKYDNPFLYMQFDPDTEKIFTGSDSNGRSIETDHLEMDGDNIIGFNGGGISVLYPGHNPACTREMGCFEFDGIAEAPPDTKNPSLKTMYDALVKAYRLFDKTPEKEDTNMETIEEMKASIASGFEGVKNDLKTMFANKPSEDGGDDMTALTDMTAKFEAAETKSVATAAEMTTLKAEFESAKTSIEAKDATIVDLTNKVAVFEKTEADALATKRTAQFEGLMAHVPLGQKDTTEKTTALHAEFETDPIGFALKAASFEKTPATGTEGAEFEAGTLDEYKQKMEAVGVPEVKFVGVD